MLQKAMILASGVKSNIQYFLLVKKCLKDKYFNTKQPQKLL
jgi:hypothetical protein